MKTNPFDPDGYFRTGDLARWVDDDYLVVTGRAKDIIIRNGENISPKEVEDVLVNHPAIAEIAIVGLPDDRTGERACAVVVPRGRAAARLDESADFSGNPGVARFKAPEQVVIWDHLPKNDAGKVLKHQIRAALITQDSDMQVAIVTGATGGIGFGCAAKLAEAGIAVLATGRDEDKLLAEGGRRDRRSGPSGHPRCRSRR